MPVNQHSPAILYRKNGVKQIAIVGYCFLPLDANHWFDTPSATLLGNLEVTYLLSIV